jgi:hypothetical protein
LIPRRFCDVCNFKLSSYTSKDFLGVRTILNFANAKPLYVFRIRTALSLEITLESHIAR